MLGLELVLQHIPRDVISAPPSELISPPDIAEICVIELIGLVVKIGTVLGLSSAFFLHPMKLIENKPIIIRIFVIFYWK